MLTSKLYSAMADGQALKVTGQLLAGEHFWNVAVFLSERPDGRWRLGRPDDSETYVLNHVLASIPARHGPNRVASNRDRRSLLNQIYRWVDEQYGFTPQALSTTESAPALKEIKTMENQCSVFTKWGLGPQCPKQALEGMDVCKLHSHLERVCGTLPRTAGDFRPARLKKAAKVIDKVAAVVAAVPAEVPMVARLTPASMVDVMEAPADLPVVAPSIKKSKAKKAAKKAKKATSPNS